MSKLQSIKQRFGIIGGSAALDQALGKAVRVANTDLTVLIIGESGVGKEVFSTIIHNLSARKHSKFIAINCGAIPEGTINSELFGHEKGAFTGATSERKGYFETVDGGTIFLDEIGEMPLDTQAFLLRVLESGEFIRVGSSKMVKTDVRIITATHSNLQERVKNGKFRQDLYYRLSTVPIQVPSLKERREDIFLLFRKFSVDFSEKYRMPVVQLDASARDLLERYSWPGNIRELKNVAEQISVLSEDRLISAEELSQFLPKLGQRNLPALTDSGSSDGTTMHEREILYKLLFEMKSDLNDLKSLVFELINHNNLQVSDIKSLHQFSKSEDTFRRRSLEERAHSTFNPSDEAAHIDAEAPIIIKNPPGQSFQNSEVVEENLSLEEMERDLIKRALHKHKGRRKDAATELGISERTLYRKIKFYDL